LIVLCNNAHKEFEKVVERLDKLLEDEWDCFQDSIIYGRLGKC
jgi:hypothetical protein